MRDELQAAVEAHQMAKQLQTAQVIEIAGLIDGLTTEQLRTVLRVFVYDYPRA